MKVRIKWRKQGEGGCKEGEKEELADNYTEEGKQRKAKTIIRMTRNGKNKNKNQEDDEK